ncbi:MAG: NAD(+)/NADH kinase, partial [Acidimicrobiaceae bacterium]|nr:NAD(+)/NADH kinase [Acidimicrobiaceae bacterium]
MATTVGVITNPRSGKDIRRLVAHASAPNDTSRIADVRRLIVGAVEGGAELVLLARDLHGLGERAISGLDLPVELLDFDVDGSGGDTARAAMAMKERSADVLAVYGGDGTHRQVARGWRDAPIVAVAGGTNNAYPQMIEPTVAGAAAGLAAAGGVPLDDLIAYQSLVIDIDVEGVPADLALIDVAVIRGDTGGSPSLWSLDGVEQIFTAVAEPWSIGLSAFAGLVAPTSRTDDRGVLLDLDPSASQRVRAPIAPGHYVEAG